MAAIPNNNLESPYALIPELGDLVTFVSDIYKSTTGRIIYRDGALIRIRPFTSSTTCLDFPLDPGTGQFRESLGVQEVIIHEKRRDPHFSKQLSVRPGEILEFFDETGNPVVEYGVVFEVIATEEYDAIKLETGQVLDFGFIGPQPPISVIRPRAPADQELDAENDTVDQPFLEEEDAFPDIDFDMLPAALVEEIPSEERTYSDSVQREDMFVSLLTDIPAKRQKDPKVMQKLYRDTDVMLALKNSIITRDESGAVLHGALSRSYTAKTIQEALEKQPTGAPIAALIPVAAVKKVLYTDDKEAGEYVDAESRNDLETLKTVAQAEELYTKSAAGGNPYITYLNTLLKTVDAYTPAKEGDARITVDQDVLRSQIPPTPVQGFPTVPAAFDKKKEPIEFGVDSLGTIENRVIRLLSSSRIRNPKTGTVYTVAQADTAETVGHVLLSKDMTAFRLPTRSSVLLWDIQASEQSRKRSQLFYETLMRQWDNQKVIAPGEDASIVEQLNTRLLPSLSIINRVTTPIIDSLGLRNLELTEELLTPILTAAKAGQAVWDRAHMELRKRALAALTIPQVPAVLPLTSSESPLLSDEVLGNGLIKRDIDTFLMKESILQKYDIALANDILTAADATLGPLWYALANGVATPPEILAALEMNYRAESARAERIVSTKRALQKEFSATPILNKCKHVHELEKIKSIKNDQVRMAYFDKFLKEYQAGQQGNWILCGLCKQDLVCKHEVLMLNEFMNPGRGEALHKALLLEYAGPVFEGSYICKTCGQKIKDIEYDTHLEFDDEGRPLVGRAIMEQEVTEEQEILAIREEAEQEIPFKGTDRTLYNSLRTLFERCGLALDLSYYERTVAAAKSYIQRSVKSADAYALFQQQLKAAKKPEGAKYETYYANQIISIVGALVVLELQTSSTPVPIPHSGCAFSRDGFPLDGADPLTAGSGALSYVACCLANIKNNYSPWNQTSWSPETKLETRIKTVEQLLKNVLTIVLSIPLASGAVAPPLEGVTDKYREMLSDARRTKASLSDGTTSAALASSSDKLPPNFRPLPRMAPPNMLDDDAIGNSERYMRNVEEGDIEKVAPVVMARQRQLSQQMIAEFHTESAKSGLVIPGNPCSSSVCCFARLGAVNLRGFGVQSLSIGESRLAEVTLQNIASRRVAQRNSASPAAGTHIYVPWSAPTTTVVLPEADPSVYYKLFMKHCFRGRSYGHVHEYGPNYVCRNCQFAYPQELIYLTAAEITAEKSSERDKQNVEILKKREELALGAFHTQGIEINEGTFRALEEVIRQRRAIPNIQPPITQDILTILQSMHKSLTLQSDANKAEWEDLVRGFTKIKEGSLVDLSRLRELRNFSAAHDTHAVELRDKMLAILGKSAEPRINSALRGLLEITENTVGNVGIRNVLQVFVTNTEQIVRDQINVRPNSTKWFPKINRSHKELLDTIWDKLATIQIMGVEKLKEIDDEGIVKTIAYVFEQFTTWCGSWLAIWRKDIRPGAITPDEYRLVLRWSIYTALLSIFTHTSSLYDDASSAEVAQHAAKFAVEYIVQSLNETAKLTNKYQLTPEQINEQIEARAEMERASFIKKFDDKEKELRKIELIKKKLKIGDWYVGNLSKYDTDRFDFERSQREQMGLPDFAADIVGDQEQAGAPGEEFGFHNFGPAQGPTMDDNEHRAAEDEDDAGPVTLATGKTILC